MPSSGQDLTLPVRGQAKPSPAYAVLPANPTRGVVVIHEIFGRQPEIDRVVHKFAALGYAAIAPDLFANCLFPVCLVRALRATAKGEGPQVDQIRAAREWLVEKTGLPASKIGLIGFCLGGGLALAAGPGFGAVSTNYGDVPPREVLAGIGPTIGCYGGRDKIFGHKGPVLEKRLPAGVPRETHLFPTVGHSFLTDGSHPIAAALTKPLYEIRYDPAVADEAWKKILAFFDQHLSASPA